MFHRMYLMLTMLLGNTVRRLREPEYGVLPRGVRYYEPAISSPTMEARVARRAAHRAVEKTLARHQDCEPDTAQLTLHQPGCVLFGGPLPDENVIQQGRSDALAGEGLVAVDDLTVPQAYGKTVYDLLAEATYALDTTGITLEEIDRLYTAIDVTLGVRDIMLAV